MTTEPKTQDEDLAALSRQLEEQERAHIESIRRANAAVAAAQDKSYWLERWQIDLNALMRKRGASEARAALRGLRAVYRRLYNLRHQAGSLPLRMHAVQRAVQDERRVAQADEGDVFARTIPSDPPLATPVTNLLYERVDPSAIAEVEDRLTPAELGMWESAPPAEHRRLALAFGVHHGVPAVLEATGLRGATPPTEIHAMERSSSTAGGSTYYADMIIEAARGTGFELRGGMAGLDFGCSSGRVVRVLAAAYPDMEWHGCDPLAEAVEWAQANLHGIDFVQSPLRPPLPYPADSLDLVFAISIWSHFGQRAAADWLAEMKRVLRPGGRLVLTTHGAHSIAHAATLGVRSTGQLQEIERALYRDGFWFVDEFGAEGDHGLHDAEWGTAFFSPEWLLRHAGPGWRVLAYHPGRVQENQDLYVLEPR